MALPSTILTSRFVMVAVVMSLSMVGARAAGGQSVQTSKTFSDIEGRPVSRFKGWFEGRSYTRSAGSKMVGPAQVALVAAKPDQFYITRNGSSTERLVPSTQGYPTTYTLTGAADALQGGNVVEYKCLPKPPHDSNVSSMGYMLEYPDSVGKLAYCKLFQVYSDKVHFTFTSGPDPVSLLCPTAPIDTPEKLAKLRKNEVNTGVQNLYASPGSKYVKCP